MFSSNDRILLSFERQSKANTDPSILTFADNIDNRYPNGCSIDDQLYGRNIWLQLPIHK